MEHLTVEVLVSEWANGPGSVSAYYVRGHVGFDDFAAAVSKDYDAEPEVEYVTHRYMRKVPDATGEHTWIASLSRNGGRGAMPVTYFDVNRQWCDRWDSANAEAQSVGQEDGE